MRIVSIINQKGGVAKTTTTANLGASLAARGQPTLLIDLDPQANLTLGLGGGFEDLPYGLPQTLLEPDRHPLAGMVRKVGDIPLYLAAGHMELARADARLMLERTSLHNLGSALSALNRTYPFAWVLIDCPPSLGALTQSAIVASTHLLIPTEARMYAFAGMDTLNRLVSELRQNYAFSAELLGVLLTMVDRNTRLYRTVSQVIRERFGDKVFATDIRRNVRIPEAEIEGKPVILFDRTSRGASDYDAVVEEILSRVQG